MFAPDHMPSVAWSHSGELNQYSDVREIGASGAINGSRPANWTTELRRHYYGAVSYLDHNVGRVLNALKHNDQEDNAVVAFWGASLFCLRTDYRAGSSVAHYEI